MDTGTTSTTSINQFYANHTSTEVSLFKQPARSYTPIKTALLLPFLVTLTVNSSNPHLDQDGFIYSETSIVSSSKQLDKQRKREKYSFISGVEFDEDDYIFDELSV